MIWYICGGVTVFVYAVIVWFVLKIKKAQG